MVKLVWLLKDIPDLLGIVVKLFYHCIWYGAGFGYLKGNIMIWINLFQTSGFKYESQNKAHHGGFIFYLIPIIAHSNLL